jgi:hypothetical protein
MNPIRSILFVLAMTASPAVSAETMKFEDSAGMLGANCGKDIEANCRGVNLDATRLKDCLTRNQDVLSPQCKSGYLEAFAAIQKRVAARSAVNKLCERDARKFCGGPEITSSKTIDCLAATPRGMTLNCTKAITEAGYR